MNNFKCPYCGKSHYSCEGVTTTAMYYVPVYKDGVNVNPDGNITTYRCKCMECGTEFCIEVRYGEIIGTRITKSVEEIAKEKEELEKARELAAHMYNQKEFEAKLEAGSLISFDNSCMVTLQPQKDQKIFISDSFKDMVFKYKGKEYTFNIEKVLDILCKEVKIDDR